MTITTRIFTYFRGRLVGKDAFGNKYYRERRIPANRREKRWVIFHGKAEPTKVPPEWHGWLHYTHNNPPAERAIRHYAWEKPHLPNLTGTPGAYVPPGHLLRGGKRAEATADYESWKP